MTTDSKQSDEAGIEQFASLIAEIKRRADDNVGMLHPPRSDFMLMLSACAALEFVSGNLRTALSRITELERERDASDAALLECKFAEWWEHIGSNWTYPDEEMHKRVTNAIEAACRRSAP